MHTNTCSIEAQLPGSNIALRHQLPKYVCKICEHGRSGSYPIRYRLVDVCSWQCKGFSHRRPL